MADDHSSLEEETDPPGTAGARGGPSVVIKGGAGADDVIEIDTSDDGTLAVPFDFIIDLTAMANELKDHPRVTKVHFDFGDSASEWMIMMIEDGLGFRLPNALKSLYRHADGYELEWTWKDASDTERMGGGFHLPGFGAIFDALRDAEWREQEGATEEELDFLWELRTFDDFGRPEWRAKHNIEERVLIHITQTMTEPDLYLFHPDTGPVLMDVTLLDYLYWAIEAHAIHRWQVLRSLYDHERDPLSLGGLPDFFEASAALFPEIDLDAFADRLVAPRDEEA